MNKYKKIGITILSIMGTACLVAAIVVIVGQAMQSRRSEENLESLRASAEAVKEVSENTEPEGPGTSSEANESTAPEVSESTDTPTEITDDNSGPDVPSDSSESDVSDTSVTEEEPVAVPNPYADVFASYEDVAAWLVIPDTVIDYPVVWTPEDENYYLYKDIDGNEDQNGSLILDTDSSLDPLSTNLIIHGHNMRSGAMFGNLTDYESKEYFENHKQISLYTEECLRNYEVIAVFRSQVYRKSDEVFKYYKFFQANTQEEFEDFYQNIKDLSLYDTGVTAEFGDNFITLSTCVYHVEQGRFVVVAKEVEPGDSYLPIAE